MPNGPRNRDRAIERTGPGRDTLGTMTATLASGPSGAPPVPPFPGIAVIADGSEAIAAIEAEAPLEASCDGLIDLTAAVTDHEHTESAPGSSTDAASQPEGAPR